MLGVSLFSLGQFQFSRILTKQYILNMQIFSSMILRTAHSKSRPEVGSAKCIGAWGNKGVSRVS